MDEKLTLQDIIDLLAKKSGLTKKEADAFFRELLDIIITNVFNEEPVKIKGFGTFKLTQVNSRESVDVNTGEKIEIPSHFKLSFIPDKALKALVNKPFSQFETTLIEDGVSFDSIETSEEIIENTEEEDTADELEVEKVKIIGRAVNWEEEEKEATISTGVNIENQEKTTDEHTPEESGQRKKEIITPTFVYTYSPSWKPEAQEVTLIVPSGKITIEEENPDESYPLDEDVTAHRKEDIPLNINKVQEKIDQLKEAVEALANNNSKEVQSALAEEREEASPPGQDTALTPSPSDNKIIEAPEEYYTNDDWKSKLKYAVIGLLLACLIGAGIYFFTRLSEQKKNYTGPSVPVVTDTPDKKENTVTENELLVTEAQTVTEENIEPQAQEEVKVFPITEVIRSGSSLRSISRRHYGKSVFWVYIYEENKGRIPDFNAISPGQEITVPDLKKYGVDPNSEADVVKAKQIEQDLYAGKGL